MIRNYRSISTNFLKGIGSGIAQINRDTWIEFVNIPYSPSAHVQFNNRYNSIVTVTANLLRNMLSVNNGSNWGNDLPYPINIDLIIEDNEGILEYTGAVLTLANNPPEELPNAFISVQIVGKVV